MGKRAVESTCRCFEQVKVHRSREVSWFERLNLEGGNVASDRIVQDNIVDGDVLAGEELNGLMGGTPAQEGGH